MSTPLASVAWAVMSLVVLLCVRLAREARAHGGAPEWLMALFFGGGIVAYSSALLRQQGFPLDGAVGAFIEFGRAGFAVPSIAIALFTWMVFRPGAGWAHALALSITGVLVLGALLEYVLLPVVGLPERWVGPGSAYFWLATTVRGTAFGWACVEAVLYWRMAARRTALGMGDPLVTNRFLLWGIWSGSAAALLAARIVAIIGYDSLSGGTVPPGLVVFHVVAGLVCAGAVWLTFAPPAFYRRWVESSAA